VGLHAPRPDKRFGPPVPSSFHCPALPRQHSKGAVGGLDDLALTRREEAEVHTGGASAMEAPPGRDHRWLAHASGAGRRCRADRGPRRVFGLLQPHSRPARTPPLVYRDGRRGRPDLWCRAVRQGRRGPRPGREYRPWICRCNPERSQAPQIQCELLKAVQAFRWDSTSRRGRWPRFGRCGHENTPRF
jgi:hypothetical protein